MPLRQIEYVPVAEIAPAVRNPKNHDLEQLRASVKRFGVIEPAVIDGRTGRLVSGHGRTETYQMLQVLVLANEAEAIDPPDGVEVGEDGRWRVPVVTGWSSKDDGEAEAAVIALNRIGERGGWDQRALADMLAELRPAAGLEGTGYAPAELDALLESLTPPEAPEEFPDLDPATLATQHKCPRCGYEYSGGGG